MNKNKKLQVFVSSTFTDLKEERQAAVQAILNAGHIPAGMELFIAGDESQWDIIKEWIDESDIYMLIIGGRYGTPEPKSGKSYTQLEFEYAISQNKPHFVIVIDDATTQAKAQKALKITDFFDNSPQLLEFKKSIMTGKLVHICDNLDKLESSVIKSINKLSQRDNLKGWVKADDRDYGSISEELARLSKENSELKIELAGYKNSGEKINGVEIGEFAKFLKSKNIENLSFATINENGDDSEEHEKVSNLLSFFQYICLEKNGYYGRFHNENNEYSFCIKAIRNYNLMEKVSTVFTESGTKLMLYLELNPHLLEENE